MNHQTLVPERFGPLSSLKIVSTGILIAQPYAAALCAEMGAEVIQVERPGLGDFAWRYGGITLDTKDGFKVATNWLRTRLRSRKLRNKWRSMFGDTVDRKEQFVHSGNDGDLGTFARAAEA